MMYKNSDLVDYGYGSFILYYEGPNEDGTQEWVVCIRQSKLINIEKIYLVAIVIGIKVYLIHILGLSRIEPR